MEWMCFPVMFSFVLESPFTVTLSFLELVDLVFIHLIFFILSHIEIDENMTKCVSIIRQSYANKEHTVHAYLIWIDYKLSTASHIFIVDIPGTIRKKCRAL